MTSPDYDGLLEFASALAREAGAVMRQYAHGIDQQIEVKRDATLLTTADTQINDLVIRRINQNYPDHGVLGEEASVRTNSRQLWVCDPIDGTNGFTIGEPTAVFSLAYVVDGVPMVAVTLDPFQDRLYTAVKGQGSFCSGQRLKVRDKGMHGAVIVCSGSFTKIVHTLNLYSDLSSQGARVRMFGGMVFKGNLVAEGKIDGVLFAHSGAHDIAAIKLIVEEAGGKVTDVEGNDQRYDRPLHGAIVSNGHIHQGLMEAVRTFGIDRFLAS